MVGKWSECTVSCDGGHQSRTVYCVESSNDTNGILLENRKVNEQYCWQTQRPVSYFVNLKQWLRLNAVMQPDGLVSKFG
ncbi:unnamed protein product [Gongylonema pulchrum]|uniref:ADAM_spacer1 domain-containing protein n=1 Tax=Gongylonema pulchrum TaxID=637853 RepID=A0A183EQJ8_9BILA|nr:unnamed protein product [Gongylonema pulchrum]